MNARQIVAGYLIAQAAGTAAWWAVLLSVPGSVRWFQPQSWPADALLGFWLADAALLVGGSCAAAAAVLARKPWATLAVWSLAAATWYPTLYCIGVSVLTGEAWIASSLMITMAGLTLAMATIHGGASQAPATIRVTPMTRAAAVGWTLGQTLIFWGAFLWVLPRGIVELEARLGGSSFSHPGQSASSIALLTIASLAGAWSGSVMATVGAGTPLPTATAPKLVVAGPYRFVRNPMAVAGVAQGVAVGWYLGSYSVIAYALAGAVVWHGFVRPVEERDLQQRFGDSYARYRQETRLWIPTPTATRIGPGANDA